MKIQILGTGCPKCKKLAEETEAAARLAHVQRVAVGIALVVIRRTWRAPLGDGPT